MTQQGINIFKNYKKAKLGAGFTKDDWFKIRNDLLKLESVKKYYAKRNNTYLGYLRHDQVEFLLKNNYFKHVPSNNPPHEFVITNQENKWSHFTHIYKNAATIALESSKTTKAEHVVDIIMKRGINASELQKSIRPKKTDKYTDKNYNF